MSTRVKVEMQPIQQILKNHGLDSNGRVQLYVTNMISRRMTRYMPFQSGALATKLKFVKSPTEIEVNAPYARYQYYGKVMVNSKTGKGPRLIPGVGFRWPKGAILKVTDRPLQYDPSKNAKAGPYWDKALMANESAAIFKSVADEIILAAKGG